MQRSTERGSILGCLTNTAAISVFYNALCVQFSKKSLQMCVWNVAHMYYVLFITVSSSQHHKITFLTFCSFTSSWFRCQKSKFTSASLVKPPPPLPCASQHPPPDKWIIGKNDMWWHNIKDFTLTRGTGFITAAFPLLSRSAACLELGL